MNAAGPADPRQPLEQALGDAKAMFAPKCEVCLTLAIQVAQRAAQAGYPDLEAAARLLWGRALLVLSGADAALPALRRARRTLPADATPRLRAELALTLAQAHAAAGRNSQALLHWVQGLEQALEAGAPALYAEAYLALGNLYVAHNDLEYAFHYHVQAAEFAAAQPDTDLRAKAAIHLAADLIGLARYDLAEPLLHGAERDLQLPLRRDWQAEIYNYLGTIHARQGHTLRAQDFLERAYAINLEAGFLWGQTVNQLGLGRLVRTLGQDQQAEAHLTRALETVTKFGAPHLSQQIHEELSQLYEQRGDFAAALHHHIAFHEHHQAIAQKAMSSSANKLAARRLAAAEIKLKLLSSEIELTQLRQQTSERATRLQQLEDAAYRDGLTAVFNRRALDERLSGIVAQAHQHGQPLSLLILDFDHFKAINDGYSHQVGDQVLQEGARLIQSTLRDGDALFRYGGEEFTLVLGDTALPGALRLAERIRVQIEGWHWSDIAPGLGVTISIGCSTLAAGDAPAELLRAADLALYEAKRAGRNRVMTSGARHG